MATEGGLRSTPQEGESGVRLAYIGSALLPSIKFNSEVSNHAPEITRNQGPAEPAKGLALETPTLLLEQKSSRLPLSPRSTWKPRHKAQSQRKSPIWVPRLPATKVRAMRARPRKTLLLLKMRAPSPPRAA